MSDEVKLLPCPFCGENGDLLAIAGDGLPFRCERCGATGPKAYAGKWNWNTRAIEATDEVVERVARELSITEDSAHPWAYWSSMTQDRYRRMARAAIAAMKDAASD